MADLNCVALTGRFTRDPEVRKFPDGNGVASFGLAVNSKKKNAQTGQYEDDTVFVDCEAWRNTAGVVEQYCQKGKQVAVRGRLKLDQWNDKTTGEKRSKLKVVVDDLTLLGSKDAEQAASSHDQPAKAAPRVGGKPSRASAFDDPEPDMAGNLDDIPF